MISGELPCFLSPDPMLLEAAISPLVVYCRKGCSSDSFERPGPVVPVGEDAFLTCASSLLPDFAADSFVDASDAFSCENSVEVCCAILKPEMDLFCVSVSFHSGDLVCCCGSGGG